MWSESWFMSLVKRLEREYRNDGDFKLAIKDWEIPDEGISLLYGPSGSGKSSVFRVLMGLDEKANLEWAFKGIQLHQLPPPERHLGVVFQSLDLFPHMTALQNIKFIAEARRLPRLQYEENLGPLVEVLKMQNFLNRPAHLLSGGEKQRVALARALISKPRLLMLDEPFSALDANIRNEIRNLIRKILQDWKLPCLLISHDESDLKFADYLFQIENGRLLR